MPVQKATALVGFAKQTAKGTIAANPTFAHGIGGGKPIIVDPKQDVLDVTAAKRTAYNIIRDSISEGASFQSPAYLKSVGLYLLAALGTDTVTGSGPYLHTYSTGDLIYYTCFAKGLDSTNEAIRDCKMDQLSLKWDGSQPLELNVATIGCVFSYPASFTPGTDETGSESFLVPVGGTFQYDLDGSTLATVRVTKGELSINNNVAGIDPSAAIEADDVYEGRQDHGVKLTIVPDNLTDFRNVITGAPAGTTAAVVPTTGSFSLLFKENNGAGTLTVTSSKCAFLCSFPEGDPKGGPVELDMVGIPVTPSGGTAPVVYALSNTQASY